MSEVSTSHKPDIRSRQDICLLVDGFYSLVRADELLSPVFTEKIGERWPEHLHKMYRFWETVLLDAQSYQGSPFAPHARLPVEEAHFVRWMELFNCTLDRHFAGPKTEEARERAGKMARLFLGKILYFREHPGRLLV